MLASSDIRTINARNKARCQAAGLLFEEYSDLNDLSGIGDYGLYTVNCHRDLAHELPRNRLLSMSTVMRIPLKLVGATAATLMKMCNPRDGGGQGMGQMCDVWSWTSAVGKGSTLQIYCISQRLRIMDPHQNTYRAFQKRLRWSLMASWTGKRPTHDEDGRACPRGHIR